MTHRLLGPFEEATEAPEGDAVFYRNRWRETLGALAEMTAMNIALEKRLAAAETATGALINLQSPPEAS